MERRRQTAQTESETDTRAAVRESLAPSPVMHPIEHTIRALVPLPIRYSDLLALFDYRATKAAIHSWRFGTRAMPQWAIELLRRKAAAHCARIMEPAIEARPGRGLGWNKNATRGLGEWRAKRNLEKSD